MVTKVLGKNIENVYSADDKKKKIFDENGELVKEIFTGKPELVKETKIKNWEQLCSFKGEPRYNKRDIKSCIFSYDHLNISENKYVNITKEIFRADLNELHLYSDKVISKTDVDKQQSENKLKKLIKDFNQAMIESNDKLKAYCDVHNLYKCDTDCIELFKLVYPESEYSWKIEDGKMKAVRNFEVKANICSSLNWGDSAIASITEVADSLATSYDISGTINSLKIGY